MDDLNSELRQRIRNLMKQTLYITCPFCIYENSKSSNYCVKCGKLLPNRERQTVISEDELLQLKKDANMSIMDKIKKEIKKI